MEIKTSIEVEQYGDYDGKYTKSIMVSSDFRNVKDILTTYCNLRGLPCSDGSGLSDNMLSDTTDDFIKYLKKEGFKELKRKKVCFTD